MVRSIIIPQDTAHGPFLVELAEAGSFQAAVDGWLEILEIPAIDVTPFVSESARRERRPLNSCAAALWWLFSADPTECPVILGDVVLTGSGGAHASDIPEPIIELLFMRDDFVVQVSPGGNNVWCDSFARSDNVFDAAMWSLLWGAVLRPGPQFRVGEPPPILHPDLSLLGGARSW